MNLTRFTSRDLENMPDDGKRYEIIDGEMAVTHAPHFNHQLIADRLVFALNSWSIPNNSGTATSAPGVIFADDDDVIPDVVWLSKAQMPVLIREGKIHGAPELVIEVLSPGTASEQRDKNTKRKLYSRRGVLEYWIVNYVTREIEVYRRVSDTHGLQLVETVKEADTLESPILPGFVLPLASIFANLTV